MGARGLGAEFYDRRWELEWLDEKWRSPGGQLLLVYGRRRVGKTRLLLEWAREECPAAPRPA